MNIREWIKNKVINFLGIKKLDESPDSQRLTFIADQDQIYIDELRTNKIWYRGSADELLNWYTGQQVFGFVRNPIYNRNNRQLFWSLSSQECNIKRTHSGVPSAIIDTISAIVGMPKIDVGQADSITPLAQKEYNEVNDRLKKIFDVNDFDFLLTQEARPETCYEGYGAWKPIIDFDLSPECPLLEFDDGENVEFIIKNNIIVGVIFKSYYKDNHDKDYVLFETRYRARGNSYIDYDLFKLKSQNDIEKVSLDTIPQLADLKPLVIEGLNMMLAVPTKYLHHPMRKGYGKSFFNGKIDLFDDLDQSLSQRSHVSRVSGPVEYYRADALERTKNGTPILPNSYNRDYVAVSGISDGDGHVQGKSVETTQPTLNFDQYDGEQKSLLNMILIGILSPASLGIDMAKRDNADAQREKQIVTIMTRNNIIKRETKQLRDLITIMLMLDEYMKTGTITIKEYNINIKYDEFANPAFEEKLSKLGEAWSAGRLSTQKFVDLLWGDTLSKEDKENEVKALDENRQKDDMDINSLFGDGNPNLNGGNNNEETNENPVGNDLPNEDSSSN